MKKRGRLTDLDCYMWMWFFRKMHPDLHDNKYLQLMQFLTGLQDEDLLVDELMCEVPQKFEMVQWLSQQGFSSKKIQEFISVSQQYVSQSVNRKPPIRPYRNRHINDTLKNYSKNEEKYGAGYWFKDY